MKIKIIIIISFALLVNDSLLAQKVITLKECYDRAMIINSLANEKEAYRSIWKLKDENLAKNWLPTLDANGNFVYNSSVVDLGSALGSLPLPVAGAIKPLPHEQYKITFDINQVIYDGGTTKNLRAMEKADLDINEKQNEADMYKLRGQINSYYFNLLLLDRQKEHINNFLELISKRISAVKSAVENGVTTMSDIDVLTSEMIKLQQQLGENEIRKASLLKILSDITGIEIDPSAVLISPVIMEKQSDELSRPELQLFELRKEQLSAGMKLAGSKRLPKAFGFATLGYGNPPGNNFFRNEFASYYILGAGIKWNIIDWDKTKNEKQVISIQQNIMENRKTDLSDNLRRLLESKKADISNLRTLLESDLILIAIKKRITSAAESQYSNGTITATEYLNELNSEKEALVNYEIHKINLVMAQIEYLNISGKEIE